MEDFKNCLGGLKENINYLFGKEILEGNMNVLSPQDVSMMLGVPIEVVIKAMKELELI